jgi:hypothetical protein
VWRDTGEGAAKRAGERGDGVHREQRAARREQSVGRGGVLEGS